MARPRLSKLDTWGNHEKRVMEVLGTALGLLRKEDLSLWQEVDINRKLWFLIHRANRTLIAKNRGLVSPPSFDANNCPDADDQERAARENKRPDFTFGFYDNLEVDPDRSAKFFVAECKRLGTPSGSWRFNENYVRHGVKRFVEPAWGYGKSAKSGAMIGYVQSMAPADILGEVNETGAQSQLPAISLCGPWKENDVSQLEQRLSRSRVSPSPFHLRHVWVDLKQKNTLN